jgi:D-3-phosphoglycerate dehydrogenase
MDMKVVIAEKVAANAIRVLKEERDWVVVTQEELGDGLVHALPDADALIVRSAVDVDADVFRVARKLRVVGRAGVGVDNIDVDAATKAGVAVMNTPGANAVAVAEHTFALMLALARHIPRADTSTKAGAWAKKSLQGTELRGKTLGVVGLGKIGLEVVKRAKAFEMEVIAHDPFVPLDVGLQYGIKLLSLDEVFERADYLTLHVALTPETAGMINERSLARMRHGVRIINCARGELIDEVALAAALSNKRVAGAAIDVFANEPPHGCPLLALDNVIATPHIAGSTNEAQDAVGVQIANQVRDYLKLGLAFNAVNLPAIAFEQHTEMVRYVELARNLGAFAAGIATGEITHVTLGYGGRLASWKTDVIRNAALQGVLRGFSERANLVNAASMAREQGICVDESRAAGSCDGVLRDVVTLTLRTKECAHVVRGAVFDGGSLRLVGIDDVDVEVPLEGNLIFMRNRDVLGLMGRLGTVLERHQVDIANLVMGRGKSGSSSLSIVQLEAPITRDVASALSRIDGVTFVCPIQLHPALAS